MIGSINILTNPLCVSSTVRFFVRRHATKKRRRGWNVASEVIEKPTAYMIGSHTMVMHPSLLAQFKAAHAGERKEPAA